jgi:hypothetical protein
VRQTHRQTLSPKSLFHDKIRLRILGQATMGNLLRTQWRHALDSDVLKAWLDFDLQRLSGGCMRLDWDGSQAALIIDGSKAFAREEDFFWIAGPRSQLEGPSSMTSPCGWMRESLISSAALAFFGGFCIDEGIGPYFNPLRIQRPDFNSVAVGLANGLYFLEMPPQDTLQMNTVESCLEKLFGRKVLTSLGFDLKLACDRQAQPWLGSQGWAAVAERQRPQIISAKQASDWLLPFASLSQEAPPQWLVDQASEAGRGRALLAALGSRNQSVATLIHAKNTAQAIEPEKLVDKAFAPWKAVLRAHNAHPITPENVQAWKSEALSIAEALALQSAAAPAPRKRAASI